MSCSEIIETNKYRELASEQASKKNCDANVELLLKHEKTELWASYHNKDKNLLLHGMAGTGKTFCALYLALKEIFNSNGTKIKN